MSGELDPGRIVELSTAFWGAKTLLSAVELGVFTELARAPLDAETLRERLGMHPRSARDFFDALVALGMLERTGGKYENTPETDHFLDRSKPTYLGGWPEICNDRLYGFWGSLTEALRTGRPQNEAKTGGSFFQVLYADPQRLQLFCQAMTGISGGVAAAMCEKFDWDRCETFIDIGGAQGGLPVRLAQRYPHLTGGNFDLPEVGPIFEAYVESFALSDRLKFQAGNFFDDPLPQADVLIMGHILHDWSLDDKKMLLKKAYDALPGGGALLVYEALIDDDRRENAFGLLMSLNMLIELDAGFDYTGADCQGWMQESGFRDTEVHHLSGPDSMVLGFK